MDKHIEQIIVLNSQLEKSGYIYMGENFMGYSYNCFQMCIYIDYTKRVLVSLDFKNALQSPK